MRERLPLLAGLALLSVALLAGSIFIADGIRGRNENDVITVTGSAKQRITSDYVIWDLSVTSQGDTAADAAPALTRWAGQVRRFLDDQGVESSELTVAPVSAETVTDDENNVTGYQLERDFEVRSSRVGAIAAVAERSSKLLARGVPVQPQPVQYVFTKLPSIRPALLAAATKDAQQRARILVADTGAHLGPVRGVDVGVFQVTSPNSTDVSDEGVYDTTTLQKDVTGVVNVTFALG